MSNAKKPKGALHVMMEMVGKAKVKLFHTSDDKAYAVLPVKKHWEVHRVKSVRMKHWIRMEYRRLYKKFVPTKMIEEAVAHLESEALFGGVKEKVWLRVAKIGNVLYIDLGDDDWRVVEIRDGDWRILPRSPCHFLRPPGLLPLPVAQRDGDVGLLDKFLRLEGEDDFLLVVAFITWALRYGGPYPMLLFLGESGSGKSTNARRVQALVDPCDLEESGTPKSEDDMMVAAKNCHLISLGNLAVIKQWLSDALCRTATGGGQRKRMLFTDDEESIIKVKRPVVVTAIENVVERKDLETRLILIQVPLLTEEDVREDEELEKEFTVEAPLILGALFTLIAKAQQRLPDVHLTKKSRMADLERWGEAVALEMGFESGHFHTVFKASREASKVMRLEDDSLVWALQHMASKDGGFQGTATELLDRLNKTMNGKQKGGHWPHIPNRLARRLNALLGDADKLGLNMEPRKIKGVVYWSIRLKEKEPSPQSPQSPPGNEKDLAEKGRRK